MKKIIISIICVLSLCISICLNISLKAEEAPVNNEHVLVKTMGNYIIQDEDKLILEFVLEDTNYSINLTEKKLYRNETKNEYNMILEEVIHPVLYDRFQIVDMIIDNIQNLSYYSCIYIADYYNFNIYEIYVETMEYVVEYFDIIEYNDNNDIIKRQIIETTNKRYSLIDYFDKAKKPMVLSTSNDAIVAEKKEHCNNQLVYSPYFKDFISSQEEVYDDDIVNIIPRNYFFSEIETVEYGTEYGYYIKTILLSDSDYKSFVSIFKLNRTLPTNLASGLNDYEFEFIPLINYTYFGYTKTPFNDYLYNFGNKDSFVYVNGSSPAKFGYSDFTFYSQIYNYYSPNISDQNYVYSNDCGLKISSYETKIKNAEKNIEYSTDNDEAATNVLNFILDFITPDEVDYVVDKIEYIYQIYEMIVSVFKPNVASENPLDTSSLFDLNFTSQNISSSTSNVVKSFSHGYKLDSNFVNDRYYIGQYNCYYSPEYKTSYLAKVNYENMSSTVEKQNLKNCFYH